MLLYLYLQLTVLFIVVNISTVGRGLTVELFQQVAAFRQGTLYCLVPFGKLGMLFSLSDCPKQLLVQHFVRCKV